MSGETYILLHWTTGWAAHEVTEVIEVADREGDKSPMCDAVGFDLKQRTRWYTNGHMEGLPDKLDQDRHEFMLVTHPQVVGLIMLGNPIAVYERAGT